VRPFRRSRNLTTGIDPATFTQEADQTASPRGWIGRKQIEMRATCGYVSNMTAKIKICNLPGSLHRRLKSRAALAGMSLSDYLLCESRQMANQPMLDEL